MELLLAEVWEDALGIDRVGLNDNFFDVGGHSLLMIRVIAKMQERTGVRIVLHDFMLGTLRQSAKLYEAALVEQGNAVKDGESSAAKKPKLYRRMVTAMGRLLSVREEPAGRE